MKMIQDSYVDITNEINAFGRIITIRANNVNISVSIFLSKLSNLSAEQVWKNTSGFVCIFSLVT